ncbi:MAG: tetratricopeptide repeat protein [Anaeromyxobacteraceae bacterium]|nr:tetratricopeptide repeat protein [Anaeromyxobacteraceae bacterium]
MRRALPPVAASILLACVAPPPHPRAVDQVSRGYAHLAAGDRERAEVAFEHALEMAPDLAEARAGLGVALRADGRASHALAQFDAAVAADPDLAEGHAGRGEALLALGQAELGESALADSLRIDPDQLAARLIRSRHLARRAERTSGAERRALLERARRDLLHAIEAHPRVALVHHDLGWVSWLQGDAAGAADSYGQAARLEPAMAEAWLGACASLAAAGRPVEAEAACARLAAWATGHEKRAPARTGAP